jgi:hypothetical protein
MGKAVKEILFTISLVLLLTVPLQLSAQGTPVLQKKANLFFKNEMLEAVLGTLSSLYAVEFSYSDNIVPIHTRISLPDQQYTLKEALDLALSGLNIAYTVRGSRIILQKLPEAISQTVRGTIVDQATGLPLIGANILITEPLPATGTSSDTKGYFRLTDVPVGRASIVVSCVGYKPRTISNLVITSGKEVVLNIGLTESVTAVNEIVVSARKNDERPYNPMAIVSARSFSVEETQRYAGSVNDPARMASGFAGVSSTGDASNALVIRGNSPRGVLWRIEGMEVPNPNHFTTEGASGGIISILSANVIGNSEFYTGAFPAQFGNVLSGVFDISLRNGNNEKREYALQASTLGLEVSAEGPINRSKGSSYLVNYRHSTLAALSNAGLDVSHSDAFRNYKDLTFKVNLPESKFGALSVFGIGGMSRSGLDDPFTIDNTNSDIGILGINHQLSLNANTSVGTSLSYSGTRISKYNQVYHPAFGTFNFTGNYLKSFGRLAITGKHKVSPSYLVEGGIVYSQLSYNFNLVNTDTSNALYQTISNFSEQDKDNTGIGQAFMQASHHLSPSLHLVYGFHFLHFGLSNDNSFEPRLAVRWQLSDKQSLFAGMGKYGKTENLQYYLARDHQPGGEVQVNKGIKFSRANHLVAGYEQLIKNKVLTKLEGYYQQLYNIPVNPSTFYSSLNDHSSFITDTLLNTGQGTNYGIELSVSKAFANHFYYSANGSLYSSSFHLPQNVTINSTYNGNFNLNLLGGYEFVFNSSDQKNIVGLNIRTSWAGGTPYTPVKEEASLLAGRLIYDMDRAFTARTANYFRTDLQVSYKRNKRLFTSEWKLDIQNVSRRQNPGFFYFDLADWSVKMRYQVGLLPVLSYKLIF